jgi:hypothetical protein
VGSSLKTGVSYELLSSFNGFSRQVSGNIPLKVKANSGEKISNPDSMPRIPRMPLTFNYDSKRKFSTSATSVVPKGLDP